MSADKPSINDRVVMCEYCGWIGCESKLTRNSINEPFCPECDRNQDSLSYEDNAFYEPVVLDLHDGCFCKDCKTDVCSVDEDCPMFLCEDCVHIRIWYDDSVGYRDVSCAKGVF